MTSGIPTKQVGFHRYFLAETLTNLETKRLSNIKDAQDIVGLAADVDFNVVKISDIGNRSGITVYRSTEESGR